MKRIIHLGAALALTTLATLAAATPTTPGTVIKKSELRSGPALDAKTRGEVAVQTKVDIVATKGGWVEIRTADGKTGWLRLMAVEPTDAKGKGSDLKGLATAGNVARTGSTGSTAATGVKGISKEDLAGAKANFDEVAQLDRYRATPAEAQQHARSAGLQAQAVNALPAQ